jgi:hypothetical protein
MDLPTYRTGQYVKLIKDGKDMYWVVSLPKLRAFFTNEEHFLVRLEINNFNLLAKNYTLFEKKYFLPAELIIRTANRSYQVKILDMRSFNKTGTLRD